MSIDAHFSSPTQPQERLARLRRPAAAGERGILRRRGRAAGAGRAERLGQIDAAQDRRRARRAGSRRARRAPRALRSATCRRSPTFPASRRCSPMSRRALRRATTAIARSICSAQLGFAGTEEPAEALRRRGTARGAGAGARAGPRRADPRRADQSSRSAGHRMARDRAVEHPLGHRAGQPRPAHARQRSRARRCGSIAARSAVSTEASPPSRHGATESSSSEERDRQKLDRKIAAELDWLRYGVTARRSRNQGRLRALHAMRRERREQQRIAGAVKFSVAEAKVSGKLVIEAKHVSKALRRAHAHPRFLASHRARRPARHRRPERRRQDDADQHPDRRGRAGSGHGAARQQSGDRLARPAARQPRSGDDAEGSADAHRRRHRHGRRRAAPRHQLHEGFSVRARAGGAAGRRRCRAASAAG